MGKYETLDELKKAIALSQEDVEDQFMRHMKFEETDNQTDDQDKPAESNKPAKQSKPKKSVKTPEKQEETPDDSDDMSDADLLAELDNM